VGSLSGYLGLSGDVPGVAALSDSESPSSTDGERCRSDWLDDANGYEGYTERYGPDDEPSVTVGSAADDDGLDFSRAAVAVAPGTTVTWVWIGDGGPHTIPFEDSHVGLGDPTADAGVHLEHTFENTGVYRYACGPHESLGQRGAIVVTDGPDD
jgi:halocyanin-like protein